MKINNWFFNSYLHAIYYKLITTVSFTYIIFSQAGKIFLKDIGNKGH